MRAMKTFWNNHFWDRGTGSDGMWTAQLDDAKRQFFGKRREAYIVVNHGEVTNYFFDIDGISDACEAVGIAMVVFMQYGGVVIVSADSGYDGPDVVSTVLFAVGKTDADIDAARPDIADARAIFAREQRRNRPRAGFR